MAPTTGTKLAADLAPGACSRALLASFIAHIHSAHLIRYDRREQYVGEWQHGRPHGYGEHLWLRIQQQGSPYQVSQRVGQACAHFWSRYDTHAHIRVLVQLRERYIGEWVSGKRKGRGTFYFASGARFESPSVT